MSGEKLLWVLAGGNGVGKTSFYYEFLASKGLPFINADILAKELDANNAEAVSYKAARLAEKLRMDLLRSGTSFCFETVFSHPSKIDFIGTAKSLGYDIVLVYIHLQTDELNQARVLQRVMAGGHTVPRDKIINRIPRTLVNIKAALPLIDIVQLYDNSSYEHPFVSIAQINEGILVQQVSELPEWAVDILSEYP